MFTVSWISCLFLSLHSFLCPKLSAIKQQLINFVIYVCCCYMWAQLPSFKGCWMLTVVSPRVLFESYFNSVNRQNFKLCRMKGMFVFDGGIFLLRIKSCCDRKLAIKCKKNVILLLSCQFWRKFNEELGVGKVENTEIIIIPEHPFVT